MLWMAATLARPLARRAQILQIKDDVEQLAMDPCRRRSLDSHARAKGAAQGRFARTREAHQNHRMFAELRAARSIRVALESGAFKPEDQQRIKQDPQAIKSAREDHGMGGGM